MAPAAVRKSRRAPRGATKSQIRSEESALGLRLPEGLRRRLTRLNGGSLFALGDVWYLFPIGAQLSSARRLATSISRETAQFRAEAGAGFANELVAVADNAAGDYLVVDASSRVYVWRPRDATMEEVKVDDWFAEEWEPSASRVRAEATLSVEGALEGLASGDHRAVVIDAPGPDFYVQFSTDGQRVAGEAIGSANMPRLVAYHVDPRLRAKLPPLGWSPPTEAEGHGNWTISWPLNDWDAGKAASLAVRTLEEAYGVDPGDLMIGEAPARGGRQKEL
jgi:hypothetical protein